MRLKPAYVSALDLSLTPEWGPRSTAVGNRALVEILRWSATDVRPGDAR